MKVFIYCLYLTEFSLEWVLSQENGTENFPNSSCLHGVHRLVSLKCCVIKAFQYSLRSVSGKGSFTYLNVIRIVEGFTIQFAFTGFLSRVNSFFVFRMNWDYWRFSYIPDIHRPTFHYEGFHGFEQNWDNQRLSYNFHICVVSLQCEFFHDFIMNWKKNRRPSHIPYTIRSISSVLHHMSWNFSDRTEGFPKCYSPIWVLSWFRRERRWLKALLQFLHSYGFSPVWVLSWFCNELGQSNAFPHFLHV